MMNNEVMLRAVEQKDLVVFYEQQLDPQATKMAAFPSRSRDVFIAHWEKSMTQESNFLRTIMAGKRVVGNIVYWEQDGKRLVGYWIGRDYWGRGIATSALSLF